MSGCRSRRHFLGDAAFGLGALAAAHLRREARAADGLDGGADGGGAAPKKPPLVERTYDLTPKPPPAPAPGGRDDLAVHGRRAEPPGPARPQAAAA